MDTKRFAEFLFNAYLEYSLNIDSDTLNEFLEPEYAKDVEDEYNKIFNEYYKRLNEKENNEIISFKRIKTRDEFNSLEKDITAYIIDLNTGRHFSGTIVKIKSDVIYIELDEYIEETINYFQLENKKFYVRIN